MGGLGSGLARFGKVAGIATAAAGAGFAALAAKGVSAASDLNEQITKSSELFGKSATEVERWSKTTASSLGLSQRAALEASGNFAGMFTTLELGDAVSAKMSKRLVGLGADLASFANQDPSEMLDRLRSGLAGEAEPLRRFGILISAARVEQEAYRIGLAKTGSELTEQQKVQARYSLILKDSAKAQGDFARTSESFANAQRIVRANLENLSAQIGGVLLPVIARATSDFGKFLGKIGEAEGFRAKLSVAFEGVREVATGLFEQLRSAFASIDFSQVIGSAIDGIGRGFAALGKLVDSIDWNAVARTLQRGLEGALALAQRINLPQIFGTITARIYAALRAAINAIDWAGLGRVAGGAVVNALNNIANFVNQTDWNRVGKEIVGGFKDALRALGNFLGGVNWGAVLGATFRAAVAVIRGFVVLFGTVALELARSLLGALGKGLAALPGVVGGAVKKIPRALASLGGLLVDAGAGVGKKVIVGIGDALTGALAFVRRKVLELVVAALSAFKFLGRFDPFKGLRDKAQASLARIEQDARSASRNIQGAIDGIHGKTVDVLIRTRQISDAHERAAGRVGGRSQAATVAEATAKAQVETERQAAEAIAKTRREGVAPIASAAAATKTAAEKTREAFESIMDSLSLKLDRAGMTRQLGDDLRVLREQQTAIAKQIKAEGETVELLRRRFEVRQELTALRRQERQARQFQALGLTALGEEPIPGVAALRKQLGRLSDVVKGTFLDTGKTRSLLQGIRKLLSGQLGVLGRDMRAKIEEILGELNAQLGQTDASLRKVTQRKIPRGAAVSAFGFAVPVSAGAGDVRAGGMTVNLYGDVVTPNPDAFLRELQKRASRTAPSRRGRHGGRNLGLG